MGEAKEGGRIVTESSAGEMAVAQGAPVEHQAGQPFLAAARCLYVEHKLLLVHETVLDDARSR